LESLNFAMITYTALASKSLTTQDITA